MAVRHVWHICCLVVFQVQVAQSIQDSGQQSVVEGLGPEMELTAQCSVLFRQPSSLDQSRPQQQICLPGCVCILAATAS